MGYDLSLVSMRSFTATTKRLFHHTPKLNMKVISNGTVLAESDETIVIEGNHYFPPSSIKDSFFSKSDTTTYCGWKGTASYYDVTSGDGKKITDAAWYYPSTMEKAKNIEGYVAFYKNKVDIQ